MAPERFEFIAALSPAVFAPESELGDTQLKLFNVAFGDPFDREIYRSNNPFRSIPESLPPVYLSVGDEDYFHLEIGTFEMFQTLKRLGHAPEFRVRNGKHSWRLWKTEFEKVLIEMAANQ